MGGTLAVDSEEHKGSQFFFVLQLAPCERPEQSSPMRAGPAPVSVRPLRVLVADDVRINQRVMSAMLQRMGHTVVLGRKQAGREVT
jgi:hypothetical protein